MPAVLRALDDRVLGSWDLRGEDVCTLHQVRLRHRAARADDRDGDARRVVGRAVVVGRGGEADDAADLAARGGDVEGERRRRVVDRDRDVLARRQVARGVADHCSEPVGTVLDAARVPVDRAGSLAARDHRPPGIAVARELEDD